MKFCPKDGSLMVPKKEKKQTVWACSACGHTIKAESITVEQEVQKQKDVEVVQSDNEALPIIDAECPKCSNKKAYWWLLQTRASDEPETKFMRCTKCKHTWRDYN